MKRFVVSCLSIFMSCFLALQTQAQQGTTIDLTNSKPPENKNMKLRAEKTTYGKLPPVKKFLQNTYTHFNYWFNANQILNETMQDAAAKDNDDYSRLIDFYPYDLNKIAADPRLDSVIQHATRGLLMHDLRNDYVDELYFLLGESYFFKKNYDTARQTFQYINYAFAPKDDDYNIPIGSNVSNKKDKSFSISSKESYGFNKNNLKNINRRNDALLWLARNYTEQKNYTEANILLNNLSRDLSFPKRLKPLLDETKSYFFFKQKMYDSSANYLAQCSFPDDTRRLKARRYYLTAQMYQAVGNDSMALNFYAKTLDAANNPELEIYAHKNIILLRDKSNASTDEKNELNTLLNKNKYYNYRDVIYYNEAEIAHQNKNDIQAEALLKQSIKANRNALSPDKQQQSRSFFLLGNIYYNSYRFDTASRCYDSISGNSLKDSLQQDLLKERLQPLKLMTANYDSIHVKDSLLALANMPEKERMAILKQKAKSIRRAIDSREETGDNVSVNNFVKQNQAPTDLFAQQNAAGSVWYFNNPAAVSAGYQTFKQKFGNRSNADNWLISSISNQNISAANNQSGNVAFSVAELQQAQQIDSENVSAKDLLATLPLTDAQKTETKNSINKLKFKNAEILMNKLGNYKAAIIFFDSLIDKNPGAQFIPNALYDKFVCYTLLGDEYEASLLRDKILREYASTEWAKKINKAWAAPEAPPASIANIATQEYSDIYDLFLAGKFDSAIRRKAAADKQYGTFYWTPQLLYIEALYNANKRNDSVALNGLDTLIGKFGSSPMARMAKDLKDILQHRKEIEDYLAKLNIKPEDYSDFDLTALENGAQRMEQEHRIAFPKDSLVKYGIGKIENENQDMSANPKDMLNHDNEDTAQVAATNNPPKNTENNIDSTNNIVQNKNAETPDTSTVLASNNHPLPKTDSLQTQNNTVINNPQTKTDTSQNAVKSRPLDDSIKNISQNIAENNPPKKDSIINKNPVQKNPPVNISKPETRTAREFNGFSFDDNAPVYVAVVLDNVDPVYSTEAANAFNRYNLLTFPNAAYNVSSTTADDQTLILIGPFKNLQQAKAYQANVQPKATDVIPWLSADKYSFIKISPQNTGKIHSKDDIQKYKNAAAEAGIE